METKQLLYIQLRDSILQDYQNKPYFSALPGERELCEMYHVSRPTVRKALELLEKEGCIVKYVGKGSFFIGNKENEENKDTSKNFNFYNMVRLRGDYTSSKVLSQKIIFADEDIARHLEIEVGSKVMHLERIRYINDVLWSITDSYVSYDICPEIIDVDFTNCSLHNTLSLYGHVPTNAKRYMNVRNADAYESMNLQLEEHAPVVVSITIARDDVGVPLDYSITRSSVYNLSIELSLQNQPGKETKKVSSTIVW